MTQEITIGTFVGGKFKYGYVCGMVVSILKNHVVINRYNEYGNEYTQTKVNLNLTKSRISKIGLNENEKLIPLS